MFNNSFLTPPPLGCYLEGFNNIPTDYCYYTINNNSYSINSINKSKLFIPYKEIYSLDISYLYYKFVINTSNGDYSGDFDDIQYTALTENDINSLLPIIWSNDVITFTHDASYTITNTRLKLLFFQLINVCMVAIGDGKQSWCFCVEDTTKPSYIRYNETI